MRLQTANNRCALCRDPDETANVQLLISGYVKGLSPKKGVRHIDHLLKEIEADTELGRRLVKRLEDAADEVEAIAQECRRAQEYDTAQKCFVTLTKVVESAAKVAGILKPNEPLTQVASPVSLNFNDVQRLANFSVQTDVRRIPQDDG